MANTDYIKSTELFISSSNFYNGLKVTFAILFPIALFYKLGYITYVTPVVLGTFLIAPSDVSGSVKRRFNGQLITIGFTAIITMLLLFSKSNQWVLLPVIAVVSFFFSLIASYGFRGSLVSLSCLLAIVFSMSNDVVGIHNILLHVFLLTAGGFWYLGLSLVYDFFLHKKEEDQLLSDALEMTGKYLLIRADLMKDKSNRKELLQEAYKLQTQINEKHEFLRETLLLGRKYSGRSHYDEKRLLILISLVEILELAMTNTVDYDQFDIIVQQHQKSLDALSRVNIVFGNHLIKLSEIILNRRKLISRVEINKVIREAQVAVESFYNEVQLSSKEKRYQGIILRNIYDYQRQLFQEIRVIRRAMANVKNASRLRLKPEENKQFITINEYRPQMLLHHLSLKSPIFRHALRISITILAAVLLGNVFEFGNPYWIILTIVVIMRPTYGLTKQRSINRILGTVIGLVFSMGFIFVVQNTYIYFGLAVLSFLFAISLTKLNYKWSATFVTISVIFVYVLLESDPLQVVQYRFIDTAIGVVLAIIANYFILPNWEKNSFENLFKEVVESNKNYLKATKELYANKDKGLFQYKVKRKEAFLSASGMNAAFQRFSQEPKSQQQEFELIYQIVTIQQTILSSIASIGNFILNHNTGKVTEAFELFVQNTTHFLDNSLAVMNDEEVQELEDQQQIQEAQNELLRKYQELSDRREQEIAAGNTVIDNSMLLNLQESHLIANQVIWIRNLSKKLVPLIIQFHQQFTKD